MCGRGRHLYSGWYAAFVSLNPACWTEAARGGPDWEVHFSGRGALSPAQLLHSPHVSTAQALFVCVCVCKEPDSPEGNISAQGCQRAGWYMVLKKNAHVCLCMHMCIQVYTRVHGTSVCGAERKRTREARAP